MPRRIENEQELLDFINNKPSKKKKMFMVALAVALIAAMVTVIAIQVYKTYKFKDQVSESSIALEEGRYEDAIEGYNFVIGEDDDNAEFYEGRADAYAGLGKYDKAIEDYHTAIDLDGSGEEIYKKGVAAGLKTGNNKNAMLFINEMKANIGKKEGEELRKETFVYPAQKALKKKLAELQKTARTSKDAYTMKLELYTYFDIDGDGVDELLTESGWRASKQKELRIFGYRKGKVRTMMDRNEYGLVSVKVYDKTGSMELTHVGNGNEEHRFYKIGTTGFKKKIHSSRRSSAAGAYSDGQWTYYSTGEYDAIGKTEFEKRKAAMTRGKGRSTAKSSWKGI